MNSLINNYIQASSFYYLVDMFHYDEPSLCGRINHVVINYRNELTAAAVFVVVFVAGRVAFTACLLVVVVAAVVARRVVYVGVCLVVAKLLVLLLLLFLLLQLLLYLRLLFFVTYCS